MLSSVSVSAKGAEQLRRGLAGKAREWDVEQEMHECSQHGERARCAEWSQELGGSPDSQHDSDKKASLTPCRFKRMAFSCRCPCDIKSH